MLIKIISIAIVFLLSPGACPSLAAPAEGADISSSALTTRAWEALSSGDFAKVDLYTDKCIGLHKEEAARQQRSLRAFPAAGEVNNYDALNNVAASMFIKGEGLFQQGRYEEAKPYYRDVIENYGFAQYWDPKGWYWKVSEKSQAVLSKIDSITKPEPKKAVKEEISLV